MDFFEAMERMKLGQKVKLASWPKEMYIGVKEEEKKVFGKKRIHYTAITSEEDDVSPSLPFSVLVSSLWECVE